MRDGKTGGPELPIWAGRTVHPPEFGRNRGGYTNGEGQWDEVSRRSRVGAVESN